MALEVHHMPAGEGTAWTVIGGDVIVCKTTGEETDGACAVFETTTPAGAGPPPHVHHREDELFYVLEGKFEFHVGGTATTASPGSFLMAPRDVPHSFQNVGSGPGKLLITVIPAGIEKFFAELGELPADAPPAAEKLADLTERYGIEFVQSVP